MDFNQFRRNHLIKITVGLAIVGVASFTIWYLQNKQQQQQQPSQFEKIIEEPAQYEKAAQYNIDLNENKEQKSIVNESNYSKHENKSVMSTAYKASYSSGIYGSYPSNNITDEKKEIEQTNYEKPAPHDVDEKKETVVSTSYKASYSTGIYGSYTLQNKTDEKNDIKDTNYDVDEKQQESKPLDRFPVQVFVRMRPLVGLEIRENHESVQYSVKKSKKQKTESLTLKNVYGRNNERDKKYTGFKQIMLPKNDNIETFNKCLLPTCIPYMFNGENICAFAYGHTGSGKTHTIFGYRKENVPGMYQLFVRELFKDKRVQSDDIFVEIRFCELYQGKVYDLLCKDMKRECFIREDANGIVHIRAEPVKCDDGKIRAYPISSVHIQTEDELLDVISNGIASRNVGSSTLHDKSSRSHAFLEFELVSMDLINERKKLVETEADILQIEILMDSFGARKAAEKKYKKLGQAIPEAKLKYLDMVEGLRKGRKFNQLDNELEGIRKEEEKVKENVNKLCNDPNRKFIGGNVVWVDLAGNEYGRDVKTKDVQEERERNEINKSLLALKECIRGLHNNKEYIGYRNSKLTMYLKKYLGGNDSKAIMITNIGSSQKYAKQTINTLQYSQLVAKA